MKYELLEPEHQSGAVFLAIAYPVCRFCLSSAFLASVETGYHIFHLYFSLRIAKNWDVSVGWFVAFTQFGGKKINYRTFDFKMHFKMKENEKILSENKYIQAKKV